MPRLTLLSLYDKRTGTRLCYMTGWSHMSAH